VAAATLAASEAGVPPAAEAVFATHAKATNTARINSVRFMGHSFFRERRGGEQLGLGRAVPIARVNRGWQKAIAVPNGGTSVISGIFVCTYANPVKSKREGDTRRRSHYGNVWNQIDNTGPAVAIVRMTLASNVGHVAPH
jgi:hypothetical protein